MNRFLSRLKQEKIIIGDGAMGTRLQEFGLKSGESSENWNLINPEKVYKAHCEYVEAGAELIETNTFGGNYIRLKEFGLEDKLENINKKAVELAKKANPDGLVAGSIGPTGKMLKPFGNLTKEEVFESYLKQITVLVENGVDVILIETMTDLNEMEQTIKASREFKIPVMAQMNFTESGNTVMGNSIEDCVQLLEDYNAEVIGMNCIPGVEIAVSLIKQLNNNTSRPLSVYPNAGKPELRDGQVIYPQGPQDFAEKTNTFISNGVKIFGGCCGTTPEVISAIKKTCKF